MTQRALPPVALVLAAAVAPLTGCGGPPPPAEPEAEVEPERPLLGSADRARELEDARAKRAESPPPAGLRFGPLGHVWTQETKDWNNGLLLTPDGDLLSFSGRTVRVHAREDGRVLHAASACSPVTEDAIAWTAPDRFVVACDSEVRAFSFPKLGSERLAELPQRVDQGAIGGGLVVVAEDGFFAKDKKGKLRILSAKDGSTIEEILPPDEVQSVAVSPDGASILYSTDGEVFFRELRTKASRPIKKTRAARGFGFSPDGRSVFGDFASFSASVVDPATGTPNGPGPWEVGSWITAVRWLDGATIAATGSDGLAVFGRGGKIPSPIGDLGEGLAVSPDGRTLCAGGRSGRIACFAAEKPAPSKLAAVVPAAGAGASPDEPRGKPAPKAPPRPEIDGKLLAKQGKKLVVQVDPAAKIEVGSTGEVSKAFSTNIGFGQMTGWIVIAEVKVASVAAGKVTLDVLAEKSSISMNGRPVNHFTPGDVRLTLSPPP